MNFFKLTSTFIVIPSLAYLHLVSSNLDLHLHEICFVNVFDSIIPVIRLETLRFKSVVLFETQVLLDTSLIV